MSELNDMTNELVHSRLMTDDEKTMATALLRKKIPEDQKLDMILAMLGLGDEDG